MTVTVHPFPATELSMSGDDTQGAVLISFLLIVVAALFACLLLGPQREEAENFYIGRRRDKRLRNALALAGDYISSATVVGTTGTVALMGFDGLFVAGSTIAALVVLSLLAGPLRARGRFTIADVFADRAPGTAVRIAAAVVTLLVCLLYFVVQLSAVALVTAQLLGLETVGAQRAIAVMIGVLIACATAVGGMRGATALQAAKTVIVLVALLLVVGVLLARFGWNPLALLDAAQSNNGAGSAYFRPGLLQRSNPSASWTFDFVGLQLSIVLGAAVMPHVVMRLHATPGPTAARRSVRGALVVVSAVTASAVLIGLGTAATVGGTKLAAVSPGGTGALMLTTGALTDGPGSIAGTVLFILVATAVFATSLAVIAGITLTASAAVGHDLYRQVLRRTESPDKGVEISTARFGAVAVSVAGITLAYAALDWNIQMFSWVALALAASSLLPALVYSLYWRRFTERGLLWTLIGGAACVVVLQTFTPVVSGLPSSFLPHTDFAWLPFQSVALISIPAGFALGWLGSVTGRPRPAPGGSTDLTPYAEVPRGS
ncbi:sodium/solute symporter [Streptomyces sp. CB02261]|uniref:sodium/solute symporter n=1 Tax=Streptomyces sp. CB02261 TaxID=1703940 RepID=UPI00093FB04A|nr:cation acetate symporter [Streptomyces sp. CB02261]